ncbi:MAG: tetratricopeptide repeat protein [Calditrichia bacterium]
MENFFELADLEEFYADHPDSIVFAFLTAKYLEAGELEKALETAETGVHKHPAYPFGHYMLGVCYHRLRDLGKAKSHLELSLAYDDKNPKASKLLGEINRKLDLPILAQESFTLFYTLDNFHSEAAQYVQQTDLDDLSALDSLDLDFPDEEPVYRTPREATDMDKAEAEEVSMDDFFDGDLDIKEDFDVNQKVGEVFGDELLDDSLSSAEEDDLENLDKTFGDLDLLSFADDDEPAQETEVIPDTKAGKDDEDPFAGFGEDEPEQAAADADADDIFKEFEIVDELDDDLPAAETPADVESFDDLLADLDVDETAEAPDSPLDFDKRDKLDIDMPDSENTDDSEILAELDEFFAEYEKDADLDEPAKPQKPVEQDLEFADLLFNEESPATPDETPEIPDESGDAFDYASLVDDLVEQTEDDMQHASETEDDFSFNLLDEEESQPEPQHPMDHSHSGEKAKFVRPPILSPTLGEIYISQGRFEEALDVFQKLVAKDPDNKRFQKKIRDVQLMIDKQNS